jgi:hypothetical protein
MCDKVGIKSTLCHHTLILQLSAEVYPERHLASKGQAQDERIN